MDFFTANFLSLSSQSLHSSLFALMSRVMMQFPGERLEVSKSQSRLDLIPPTSFLQPLATITHKNLHQSVLKEHTASAIKLKLMEISSFASSVRSATCLLLIVLLNVDAMQFL